MTAQQIDVHGLPAKWREQADSTERDAAKHIDDRSIIVAITHRAQTRRKCADELEAALRQSGEAVATDTFVQTVPDGCDRIVWRGHYYHLPVHPPATSGLVGGVALIAAERKRQIEVEGWSPEHDDEYEFGSLAAAATCYSHFASLSDVRRNSPGTHERILEDWPWDESWWKPGDRVRDLVKAGALIAAEIERLQRAALAAHDARGGA